MNYVQDIILDINSNTAYTTIGAKQGDGNSRSITAHLTDNGQTYTIEDGVTAYFRFRKPDGNAIINVAEISADRHSVLVTLTAQTLIAPGRGYADIVLQRGSEVLSTVSFIIIIMASPAVADQIVSSDEFGYLNAVVADSLNTIYEAEAWADGTKGGIAVCSADYFNFTHGTAKPSYTDKISNVDVSQPSFYGMVGHKPGLSRDYTFTYKTNERWGLVGTIYNGSSGTKEDEKIVTSHDLYYAYGITVECFGGAEPNENNFVKVEVAEVDPNYENNAKYYSEIAGAAVASAEELYVATIASASQILESAVQVNAQAFTPEQQEIARDNINAQVVGDYITNPSVKAEGQYLTYSSDGWAASTIPDFIENPSDKTVGQYLTYGSDGWAASTLADYVINPIEKSNGQYLTYNSSVDAWYATTLPTFILDPQVKSNGNLLQYSNNGWVASNISAFDLQGMPSILTTDFYGEQLPSSPVPGQIFFMKST